MITKKFTRREFIKQNSLTSLGTIFGLGIPSLFATECEEESQAAEGEPIIDIHQHTDQTKHSYPEGKVTSGEWTDQLLSRYPNMYGDLSQASGLNVLI